MATNDSPHWQEGIIAALDNVDTNQMPEIQDIYDDFLSDTEEV